MGFKIENSKLIEYTEDWNKKSIIIPDGITEVGYRAFSHCSNPESITIPDSVVSIKAYAFYDCSNLKSITIPNNVVSIEERSFSHCLRLESITIPDSVVYIEKCAFSGCSGLESVSIPDSVVYIGEYAFAGCSRLESVSIPETLTNISNNAFNNCSSALKIIKRKINPEKTESEPVDYKELFINTFYAKELSNKENIFNQVNDESIKIPFAVFLFTEFESQTAFDYISENSQKVLHYLVDENKIEVMSKIIPILNQKQ